MSEILIRGMQMPVNCDVCPICDCPADAHIDGYSLKNRPGFCPLDKLAPHGPLIDADKLRKFFRGDYYGKGDYWEYLEIEEFDRFVASNTIVPSSKIAK